MLVFYWLVRSVDFYQEEQFCYKEVDVEVFVDGITVILEFTEKVKCEDVNQEINKGQ